MAIFGRRPAAAPPAQDEAQVERIRQNGIRAAEAVTASARAAPSEKITPLDEFPPFAKLAVLTRALSVARQDRQNALDLLLIEAELSRPATSEKGPRVASLRERAATLRKAVSIEKTEAPSPDGLPPTIAKALALIAGEKIAPETDRAERIKALRAEMSMIDKAMLDVAPLQEELRAEQSLVVANQLVVQHRETLRAIYAAAAALAAATDAERRLFAAPLTLGYDPRPDVLPRPALDAASRLGSLEEHDSQINNFRRRLEALGVIQ